MQDPCTGRCDVGFLFVLTWVGDCKTNFENLLHRSPHAFQRWRCRPVARCVDLLPDGMVDLIFDPMHTRRFCLFLEFDIQVVNYSTNIMRRLCVSSVFTVM